jgi:hypothetical protein
MFRFSKLFSVCLTSLVLLFSAQAMSQKMTVEVLSRPTPFNLLLAEKSIKMYDRYEWIWQPGQTATLRALVKTGKLDHIQGIQSFVSRIEKDFSYARAVCFDAVWGWEKKECLENEGMLPEYIKPFAGIGSRYFDNKPWRHSLVQKDIYLDEWAHRDPVNWSTMQSLEKFCKNVPKRDRDALYEEECYETNWLIECKEGGWTVNNSKNYSFYCSKFIDATKQISALNLLCTHQFAWDYLNR